MSGNIRAGDLNRLISIQSRSTAQDTFGGQLLVWTEVKKVYAHIEGATAREFNAALSKSLSVTHMITVRYDSIFADPKTVAAMRGVYNARIFAFTGSINEDERDRIITLSAWEGQTKGG